MTYEAPELFELGDAGELTQFGCAGLRLDFGDFPRIFCQLTDDSQGGV